ncbi:hypothetical protein WMY93_018400 [Mugilogobius chulae]|uniref:Uncharacterized protein n=1 Tax=Mugilogobius chulae TaxID=88201 RepID=A0AAW0NQL7_9GOBI
MTNDGVEEEKSQMDAPLSSTLCLEYINPQKSVESLFMQIRPEQGDPLLWGLGADGFSLSVQSHDPEHLDRGGARVSPGQRVISAHTWVMPHTYQAGTGRVGDLEMCGSLTLRHMS